MLLVLSFVLCFQYVDFVICYFSYDVMILFSVLNLKIPGVFKIVASNLLYTLKELLPGVTFSGLLTFIK